MRQVPAQNRLDAPFGKVDFVSRIELTGCNGRTQRLSLRYSWHDSSKDGGTGSLRLLVLMAHSVQCFGKGTGILRLIGTVVHCFVNRIRRLGKQTKSLYSVAER